MSAPWTRPNDTPDVAYPAGDHNPSMSHSTTPPASRMIEPGDADEPQWHPANDD